MYELFTRQCITDRKLNFDMDYKSGQQGLQNGAAFRDCKSGQKGLQIGAGSEITKRGKRITNQDKDYKMGQKDYKSGQGLQIGRGITNRCRRTDTKSFSKILRQVKGDKEQALQNQHELPPPEKSLNYFMALLQKQIPEFLVK